MQFQQEQMLVFQQQQTQMMEKQQELILRQQQQQEAQNSLNMNRMMEMLKLQKTNDTKVKCPKWEEEENIKHFLNRLQSWNDIEKGRGKYLQLLEALQSSGRKKEKQRIELETQNGMLDPADENIILAVVDKMKKWFGKTKIDEASEAWKSFRDIARNKEEPIDDFLFRFETAESKMRQAVVQIPNQILALQLLEGINVTSDQRRNILVNVKVENTDTVYDDMKSSVRLMKGSLVENVVETKEDTSKEEEEINFNKNEHYRNQSRSGSRQRSNPRSFDRNRSTSWERGRRYDRNYSRDRNRGRYNKSRSYSRSRGESKERRGNRSYEAVNLIFKETGAEAKIETSENLDKMIIDCGTTKTVAGKKWMMNHLSSLPEEERRNIQEREEDRYFRFGNSIRYPSKREVTIPIKLGKLDSHLNVSVVDASIPLLLGKPDLKRLGFVINFEDDTVYTTKTHELFPLETTFKGHLALSLVEENCLDDEIFMMSDCEAKEKEKRITRIHKVLAHPLPHILKTFFKNSSENDPEVMDIIDAVHEKCEVCRKFRKSPARPKVAFPMSDDFNKCVALDLKQRNKKYILYCVCTFSRLTRAIIIKDKLPKTIVSGILKCWVLGNGIGPGIPDKFLFDNGGEFNNIEVLDLAEKHGMKMHGVTAAHSPFSNGLCEKNHEIVDRMMEKTMADDKAITETDALDNALFAKNIEPNNKGFSPFQIVYGTNPTIPGISNSTPPSLSSEFASKDVRNHIARIDKAREAFRAADNDERIKRALKARIVNSNDEQFHPDDKVYFKQDKKIEWSGPASVIGQQGKVIFLRYGNNLRRVHKSKVIRVGEEYKSGNVLKDKPEIDQAEEKSEDNVNDEQKQEEDIDEVDKLTEDDTIPKRKSILRCPKKSRRIIFKLSKDHDWTKAIVKDVAHKPSAKQFACNLLLDNSDEMTVDFSDGISEWEYEKFHCDKCSKCFETKRSLRMHKQKTHEVKTKPMKKVNFQVEGQCEESVQFNENNELNDKENEEGKDIKRLKVRFKEIIDERRRNDEWLHLKSKSKTEETMYAEIKETPENSEKVNEAKEKELKNFDDFKVYEEIEYKEQTVLGTRYVLTQKADGSIKARFVVKGFQEEFGESSDSPTSSRETIKAFLSVSANEKFLIKCSDVRSAFLQSDALQREIFVEPPPERKVPGIVWKLNKPCYGLNDASRQWFLSFKSTLLSLGMKQSKRESCLFYLQQNGKLHGLLIFHVDDVLSAGDDMFECIMEKLRLKYTFGKVETKNFVFTGMQITQSDNMEVYVDQENFVKKVCAGEYEMNGADERLNMDENKTLRSLQGQLSWLSTQTRPDLSFDAFQLSTVLNRSTVKDAKQGNKVVKKMKEKQVGLKFKHLGNIQDLHIEVFADASLGNIEEGIQTKSAMGYFICLTNSDLEISPLHWKSSVIDKVAEDIKTAETLALEKSIDDAIHFSNLLTEIYTGKSTENSIPIVANTDSKSLLESIYSTKKVKRKTMRVVVSSIQQHLQQNIVAEVHHVKSSDNIADVFTKKGVATERIFETLKNGSLIHRN